MKVICDVTSCGFVLRRYLMPYSIKLTRAKSAWNALIIYVYFTAIKYHLKFETATMPEFSNLLKMDNINYMMAEKELQKCFNLKSPAYLDYSNTD